MVPDRLPGILSAPGPARMPTEGVPRDRIPNSVHLRRTTLTSSCSTPPIRRVRFNPEIYFRSYHRAFLSLRLRLRSFVSQNLIDLDLDLAVLQPSNLYCHQLVQFRRVSLRQCSAATGVHRHISFGLETKLGFTSRQSRHSATYSVKSYHLILSRNVES